MIRNYSIEDLAHILYDTEHPALAYSWKGVGDIVRAQYIERVKSLPSRFVAEKLADHLELTGDHGANGWLYLRDKEAGTSPEKIKELRLAKR